MDEWPIKRSEKKNHDEWKGKKNSFCQNKR